jgi:hypothetical protein
MSTFKEDLRHFLEEKSLYSWVDIDLPELKGHFYSVDKVEMECPICKKSRPFSDRLFIRPGSGTGAGFPQSIPPKLDSDVHTVQFTCNGCLSCKYVFFVDVDTEKKRVRKVGQTPAWSINLDRDIEKFLGVDSEYFKKAMICESQGYGIAAFSYYRRVLENSIGNILQKIRSILKTNNASVGDIEKIDKALNGIVMDERIKIAKDAMPIHLQPNQMNPLAIIYDTLSAGIHRLSEQECLDNSNHIRVALSYLIKAITQQNDEQKAFLDSMKSLNNFNSRLT